MYTKNEVILKAENISLKYDRQILIDVNLEIKNIVRPGIEQGQVVTLIGRSGMGKTQMFKILAGLKKPNTGQVLIDVDQHPVRAGEIGIVHQNFILFNHRTIYNNLEIGLNQSGKFLTVKQKEEIILEYANEFQLKEHLHKYPMQLSGGQRQRASIIQQVLTGNKFILMDEPFSGLDPLMIDKVMNLLVKVSTKHELNTLVIISHDIENSFAISDTAYILAQHPHKEGATIIETIDLIELGFAWDPAIKTNKLFQDLVFSIKDKM